MVIIIAAIIIFIVVLTLTIRLRNRKRIRDAAEASYQKLIRKFNLTILEIDLIEELASTLRKPEDKYNLLLNKSRFRQAEHKIESFTDKQQVRLEELKIKLGFIVAEETLELVSTLSFLQGAPVKLLYNGHNADAEIYSMSESNITVKCPKPPAPVTMDTEIMLITSTGGRLRIFPLTPEKVKADLFSAPHSEAVAVEKLKVDIDIEIEIVAAEDEDEETIELSSTIVLLSEKGAFIQDKRNVIKPGDMLRLFLDTDLKKKYPVYAEAVKISSEKQLVSVRFVEIRE